MSAVTPRYDVVLFDLDGTLIETAPEICDAVNDTLRQFHLPVVTQQQVNDWIGHGTRTLLIQALAFAGETTVDTVSQADSLALIAAQFDKHYQRRCGTRSHGPNTCGAEEAAPGETVARAHDVIAPVICESGSASALTASESTRRWASVTVS